MDMVSEDYVQRVVDAARSVSHVNGLVLKDGPDLGFEPVRNWTTRMNAVICEECRKPDWIRVVVQYYVGPKEEEAAKIRQLKHAGWKVQMEIGSDLRLICPECRGCGEKSNAEK